MLTKILIKRRFQEGKTREIITLLNDMRSEAIKQRGYVHGQTLVQPDDPQNYLVISTWESLEFWHQWKDSETRKTIDAMLEVYQAGPTEYEEYVLGTPFHEQM
jgi:heme-degrading monooxygenase HmoA